MAGDDLGHLPWDESHVVEVEPLEFDSTVERGYKDKESACNAFFGDDSERILSANLYELDDSYILEIEESEDYSIFEKFSSEDEDEVMKKLKNQKGSLYKSIDEIIETFRLNVSENIDIETKKMLQILSNIKFFIKIF